MEEGRAAAALEAALLLGARAIANRDGEFGRELCRRAGAAIFDPRICAMMGECDELGGDTLEVGDQEAGDPPPAGGLRQDHVDHRVGVVALGDAEDGLEAVVVVLRREAELLALVVAVPGQGPRDLAHFLLGVVALTQAEQLEHLAREHSRLLYLQQQVFGNFLAEANRLGEVGRKEEMKRIFGIDM